MAPSVPSVSAGEVVLAIVSEKTGYPADMLGLEMEMEAELGIDSIKQVEILAALQAKFPGAPEIPASELAGLRTLQDVVDTVGGFTSAGGTELQVASAGFGIRFARRRPAAAPRQRFGRCRRAASRWRACATARSSSRVKHPDFADALERALTAHGIKARAVDEVPHEAGAVICLAALAAAGSPEECVDMHVRAFHAARSVAKSSAQSRLFVTVQSTGAGFAGC